MLEIQKQLLSGKTHDEVCEPLGIKWKIQDEECLFSYDQIKSFPFKTNPIVMESRGLILNCSDWSVASMGFNRFFNLGEAGAEELPKDLTRLQVLEKRDGTYIALRYHKASGSWKISTRNMLEAEGPVGTLSTRSFADLFWEGAEKTNLPGLCKSGGLNPKHTYIFELTSIENRIVTRYLETDITLLTVRNNETLDELSRGHLEKVADILGCNIVKIYPMTAWEELLKMEDLDPLFEGFVVVWEQASGSHKRVKLKTPSYLMISKLTSSHTERAFLELIKANKQGMFLGYYPEYKKNIEILIAGLRAIEYTVTTDWMALKSIRDRKEFALQAKKCGLPHFLFALKDGRMDNCSVMDYIRAQRTDSLLEWMKMLSYQEPEPENEL